MKIEKLSTGRWRTTWYEKKLRKRRTFPAKSQAQRFAEELAYARSAGLLIVRRTDSVRELIQKYCIRLKGEASEKHYIQSQAIITRAADELGWILTTDLNGEYLLAWIEEQKDHRHRRNPPPISRATKNRHTKRFKAFFNWLVREEHIPKSPLANVRLAAEGDSRQHPRFLSAEEIPVYLETIRQENQQAFDIAAVLIASGLRRDELVNLKKEDIDWEGKVIRVQKKKDWQPKWHIERNIPVREEIIMILSRQPDAPYIFSRRPLVRTSTRRKLVANVILRQIRRAAQAKPQFNDVGLHSLRHTFISTLVMRGIDLRTVMQLVGHRNFKTTLRYSHLAPGHLRAAIEKGTVAISI